MMMGLKFKNGGFTLVEMLIAMAIFMMFTGILIGSYGSIVKSQREANEVRIMYASARQVFETLIQELRNGMVDYEHYDNSGLVGGKSEIYLISKDATEKTHVSYDESEKSLKLVKNYLAKDNQPGLDANYGLAKEVILNSQVQVENFRIYVSPSIDPYDPKFVSYDKNQFHPKVTIYARFMRVMPNGRELPPLDLQTTVSSRIYNQVYPTEFIYTNVK